MFALIDQLPPFVVNVLRLAIWLVILSVIFVPLERFFAVRREKILRKQIGVDLAYYFINSLLPALILSFPLALVAMAAKQVVPSAVHATIAAWPLMVKAGVALVVAEIGAYWGHRWCHEVPLLWRIHAIHHSAEHIDFVVNTRAHPLDLVFVRLCGLVPIVILGLGNPFGAGGSIVPAIYILVTSFWGFFIHANLRWRFGPLEWLVSTPAFHHWHHTLAAPTNRNYAAVLPWVDKLFGTFHLPRNQWPIAYGIPEATSPTLAGQLSQPLRELPPAPTTIDSRHTGVTPVDRAG